MKDLLRNFLYTGIGLVSLAAEKLQVTVDDLVEQGKLSQEEGKKIVDDFFRTSEAKRDEFESRVKKMAESLTSKFDLFGREVGASLRYGSEELEDKLTNSEPVKAVKDTASNVVAEAQGTVKAVKKNTRKKVGGTNS